MSQLLSSTPPLAVNSRIFLTHRFPEARFLTAGVFVGKGRGFSVKPTERVKLTVKSRYSDSSSPAYSQQNGKTHLKKACSFLSEL